MIVRELSRSKTSIICADGNSMAVLTELVIHMTSSSPSLRFHVRVISHTLVVATERYVILLKLGRISDVRNERT